MESSWRAENLGFLAVLAIYRIRPSRFKSDSNFLGQARAAAGLGCKSQELQEPLLSRPKKLMEALNRGRR